MMDGLLAVAKLRQRGNFGDARARVCSSQLPAALVPPVQAPARRPQHGGLVRIEARVPPDRLEGRLVTRAMEAQDPGLLGGRVVIRGDRAAVAQAEQVLGGEETE